jgi:predicted transcriptional regulator
MKYRSKIDIISQILNAANGSSNATKTRIIYQAFLSSNQLEEHLLLLTEKGLLRYNGNTRTFRTTEKGIQFLEIYNHLEDMIKYEHKKENENNSEYIEADKERIKQISKV